MAMTKSLRLIFTTDSGTKGTISINKPALGLANEAIKSAGDAIADAGVVMAPNGEPMSVLAGAEYVIRDVEELEL